MRALSRLILSSMGLIALTAHAKPAEPPRTLTCVTSATESPPRQGGNVPIKWGDDGTRDKLSDALGEFFGQETGEDRFISPDDPNYQKQADGKYLLADQLRVPLSSLATPKCTTMSGDTIYEVFIFQDPLDRAFIETHPDGHIVGAALADVKRIKDHGRVAGVLPRVTLFYRGNSPPPDLRNQALATMRAYYAGDLAFARDKIQVELRRLPGKP